MSFTERRHARRLDLQLPVTVWWRRGAERLEALTISSDLSSHGIYFSLPEGINEGTPVELEMTLPNQITLAGPLRVHCFGQIKRCEIQEGGNAGIAVQIEKYEFLPDKR